MLASLKIIGLVAGVTGAVGGIAYAAIGQAGSSNDSLTQKSSNPTSQTVSAWTNNENCTFIDVSRKEIFYILGAQVKDHVAAHCQSMGAGDARAAKGDKWTVFFPKAVFKETNDLTIGASFNFLKSSTTIRKELQVGNQSSFWIR